MPSARANVMQQCSLGTMPLNHSESSGLRMCVDGVPFSGRKNAPSLNTTGSLLCAPASESRRPFSPAIIGRYGNDLTISSNFSSVQGAGVASPFCTPASCGTMANAPAHSPPIASSKAKSSSSGMPKNDAMRCRCASSGSSPEKNGRSLRLPYGSPRKGSE